MSKNLSQFLNENLLEQAKEQIDEKIIEKAYEKEGREIIEKMNERIVESVTLNISESITEKVQLLDEIDAVLSPKKSLNFAFFAYILLSLVFAAMIVFPKIYIQQQIYFKSRYISKLKSEYDTLKEENRLIQTSVESIKFKNQILDTLF